MTVSPAIGFLSISRREDVDVVELSHDYLAEQLESVQPKIGSIWPLRKLREAVYGAELKPSDLAVILERARAEKLDIGPREGNVVLNAALAAEIDAFGAFEVARDSGAEVHQILEEAIDEGQPSKIAVTAVKVLRTIQTDERSNYSERALRRPDVASSCLRRARRSRQPQGGARSRGRASRPGARGARPGGACQARQAAGERPRRDRRPRRSATNSAA